MQEHSVTISGHSYKVTADGEQAERHSPAGEERHFLASLCCLSLSCDIADPGMYVSGLFKRTEQSQVRMAAHHPLAQRVRTVTSGQQSVPIVPQVCLCFSV